MSLFLGQACYCIKLTCPSYNRNEISNAILFSWKYSTRNLVNKSTVLENSTFEGIIIDDTL
jgi:hypothetical protein